MKYLLYLLMVLLMVSFAAYLRQKRRQRVQEFAESNIEHLKDIATGSIDWKAKDDAYWKKVLTPLQYNVTRQEGTEPAFSGFYDGYYENGIYHCSNCGLPLFSSQAKYNSKTGWPSFYEPINDNALEFKPDRKLLSLRTEVSCARCGAHLGHVFDDGPEPTGKRYCINSVSLRHSNYMPK